MNIDSPSAFGGKRKWRFEAFANAFQNIKKKDKTASACIPSKNKENDSPGSQKGHHMFFRHEIRFKIHENNNKP